MTPFIPPYLKGEIQEEMPLFAGNDAAISLT
jgi:hypothetical protein